MQHRTATFLHKYRIHDFVPAYITHMATVTIIHKATVTT